MTRSEKASKAGSARQHRFVALHPAAQRRVREVDTGPWKIRGCARSTRCGCGCGASGEKRSSNAPKVNLRGVRIAAANVPIDTKPAAAPAQIAAPDLSIDNAAIEDKERSDFTRMLMKELRT